MFMGAILLLAAALTWGTGLTMSPHGDTAAKGTEYLRTSVVTFKRNGAIGTLILCALAGWLLFPARRPKWPVRDGALVALVVFLAGSSIYTLLWLGPSGRTAGVEQIPSSEDTNIDANASAGPDPGQTDINAIAMNVAPEPDSIRPPVSAVVNRDPMQVSHGRPAIEQRNSVVANDPGQQPLAAPLESSRGDANELANNEVEQNQD
jgi:hypothetical protein